jgi:hypothetical protein
MTDEPEQEPRLIPTFEEVARRWLVRRGVPEESITPAMISQEEQDFLGRMRESAAHHDRAMTKLREAPVPATFANSQDRNTSYEAVMEKLYWGLRWAGGEELKMLQTTPDFIVGVNIGDAARMFELDPATCRQSLEKAGFSLREDGLVMDHPSYNHAKNFFRQAFNW